MEVRGIIPIFAGGSRNIEVREEKRGVRTYAGKHLEGGYPVIIPMDGGLKQSNGNIFRRRK